jgi:prepilin-type N-terminal cleavage/methylation domain-containing protein
MKSFVSRGRPYAESGFTLVELIVTCAILGILMTGLVNIFVSGVRASADANARMTSQQNVRLAFDRLEYDVRCAQQATLVSKVGSNAAGVYLSIPTQCAHSTGSVTWCVSSGTLVRIVGSTCSVTAQQKFVTSVTSATPFSCYAPTGATAPLPQLDVNLTVNTTPRTSDKTTAADAITMRNAATGACS